MAIEFLTGLSGAKRVLLDGVYVGYVTPDLEFRHDNECNVYVSHETRKEIISKMKELKSEVNDDYKRMFAPGGYESTW